jgi:hypothetical protein
MKGEGLTITDTSILALRLVLEKHERYFVTAGQIAQMTGAKPNTVNWWTTKHDFPSPLAAIGGWKGQGVKFWHLTEVVNWLAKTDRNEYWAAMQTDLCSLNAGS